MKYNIGDCIFSRDIDQYEFIIGLAKVEDAEFYKVYNGSKNFISLFRCDTFEDEEYTLFITNIFKDVFSS